MKPVLFCDFDGVINQFPYIYNRVMDADDRAGFEAVGLEIIKLGLNDWALQKQVFDDSKFFAPDGRFFAKAENGEFLINYSSEMVDRLRSLIVSDKVEFIWLTTWREHTAMLNEKLGFPDMVSWLPWQQRMSDYNHAGKGHAIADWFEDNPEFSDRKWVWLDDVATRSFCNWNENEGFVEPPRKLEAANINCLILDTDDTWGISREQMNIIETFVSGV